MTPLERLRLASALSHAAPGAELRLHTDRGELIVVSHHPSADLDPCAMRRVVAASACPQRPDLADRVVDVSFGGALIDLGGGVLSSCVDGVDHRWIASLLQPRRVADLLDEIGLDAVPDEALHACVKPDADLGVTVLAITADDAQYTHALDAVAARSAAACFVEELRCAAANIARRNDRTSGNA